MATVQKDGVTAVTGSSTRNNRGVVKHAGTIGHSRLVSQDLADSNESPTGSRIINNAHIDQGMSSGNFAKMLVGKYIMRKVTEELAGVATTVLLSGASDFGPSGRKPVHNFKLAFKTRRIADAIRNNKFNDVTGEWDSGYPASETDTFSADHVATASRSAPGEFVYRTGAKNVTLDDYPAKTG